MQKELYLPVAVVVGCGLIGAGLYLGLRESGSQRGTAASPADFAASSRPSDTTAPAPSPPAQASAATGPGAHSGPGRDAEQAVRALVENEKKTRFVPRCWEPAVKAAPDPPKSRHLLSLSFDAEGRENIRAWGGFRGETRQDVSRCLNDLEVGLRLSPPPGAPLVVEIVVELP